MATKICTKCGTELELNSDNFYKQASNKDGYQNYCKVCRKAIDKARVHTQEYKDTRNKQFRDRYATDKEFRDNIKEKVKPRKQTEKYKKQAREYQKQYRIDNPDKCFNKQCRYRAREKEQGEGIAKEQWKELNEFFEWCCAYSWMPLKKEYRHIDHIIPLSKGGVNEVWNLIPCMDSYNCCKNNREPLAWYQAQEYYSDERLEYIIYYQKVMYWNFANKETAPLVLITGEILTYEDIVNEYGELE